MNRGRMADDTGVENGDEKRATETIRAEIDRTRASLDRTVDALQQRLDPQLLIHRTFDSFRENAGDVASKLIGVIRRNPVPAALIVLGLVWLIAKPSARDHSSSRSGRSLRLRRASHSRFGSRFGRTEVGCELGDPIGGSVGSLSSRISMGREEDQSGSGGS